MEPGGTAHFRNGDVVADRYVIERLLGKGGMGEVYVARDRKLRRRVAIKTVHPAAANAELGRERLRREAETVAQLEHPGIVAIYDVLEEAERVLLVMEFVEGVSLGKRVRTGPMPPHDVSEIVSQVAAALAAAHERGLIHRDVKPDNVMLRPDGRVALLDFGIAKMLTDADATSMTEPVVALTGPGVVVGTTLYLAPEQARGEFVDAATDQFSLAVTAYELLSGQPPWPMEDGIARIVAAILQDAPLPLSAMAGVTPEVETVLAKAMSKRPEQRYESVTAFADAFAHALAKSPERAPDPIAATVSRISGSAPTGLAVATPTRRNPRLLFPAIGFVAALGSTLAVWHFASDGRTTSDPPNSDPSAAASNAPKTGQFRFADLTPSRTAVPAAAAAYRRALSRLGHGEALGATTEFEAAIAADPEFASAHLQRLIWETYYCPTRLAVARPHFAAATRAKDTLSPRDRGVLDALEPGLLDPPDLKDVAARLRALTQRFPEDAQIWDALGVAENKLFHFRASAEAHAHAMTLDTNDTMPGEMVLAQDLVGADRARVLDECLQRNSQAEMCHQERANGFAASGSCTQLEDEARALMAFHPDASSGPRFLANALAGEGAPTEAIALALADTVSKSPEASRELERIKQQIVLSAFNGDFASVLAALDGAGEAGPVWTAPFKVEALWEIGDRNGAGEAALAYLKRAAALPRFERPETDPLPLMLARAREAGAISDADYGSRRDGWSDMWRKRLDDDAWASAGPVVWAHAFSHPPTIEHARRALERLPTFGALPPIANRQFWTHDGPTGELLRMAGRLDDALPRFRGESQRCSLDMMRVQAELGLAKALEEKGDKAHACESYNRVLARWGDAKPRSITADEARERSKAMGCSAKPKPDP